MGRPKNEFHLFYDVGDDEVQIDSYDTKMNEQVLEFARAEPGAVVMIDADDSPKYLRAAVKNENVSISFKKNPSGTVRRVRSENGKRNSKNLKNQNQKEGN